MNICDPLSDETDDTENYDRATEEIMGELSTLIGDIDRFLQGYCERAQRCAVEQPSIGAKVTPSLESTDQRENWEKSRARVEERIREQVDLLANAWLKLETEQRAFLRMKERLAVDGSSRGDASRNGDCIATTLKSVPGGARSPLPAQPAAVDEFRKLRHEIQMGRPHHCKERN